MDPAYPKQMQEAVRLATTLSLSSKMTKIPPNCGRPSAPVAVRATEHSEVSLKMDKKSDPRSAPNHQC